MSKTTGMRRKIVAGILVAVIAALGSAIGAPCNGDYCEAEPRRSIGTLCSVPCAGSVFFGPKGTMWVHICYECGVPYAQQVVKCCTY